MLKIRLMRIGGKQRPFYRVVVIDERSKRNGAYIELLGTYNPLTTPKEIKLKQDRIDHWVKQGAQMSDGFLRIIGKAPQRPPRKPKKEKKESSVVSLQTSDKVEDQPKAEEVVQKDSENPVPSEVEGSEKPEDQKISESDNQTKQVSETSETPAQSDSSGTPSPSESSESTGETK